MVREQMDTSGRSLLQNFMRKYFVKNASQRHVRGRQCQQTRRKPFGLFAGMLFAFCALPSWNWAVAAQNADNEAQQLGDQRRYLLNLMAYSDDPVEKRLTIQKLNQMIEQGDLTPEDEWTMKTLSRLSQQGAMLKSYDAEGNLLNDSYSIRAEAVVLLGKLGGKQARDSLISVLRNDEEAVVAAIAMESLLKADPDGSPMLMREIATAFYEHHYRAQDNTLAKSFLLTAAEYAARSAGKLLLPILLQAVHAISLPSNSYISPMRSRARSLLLEWVEQNYPLWDEVQ